jgi:predicted nucleic acid-binding protein
MIYADTSFFVALKVSRELQHPQAARLFERRQDEIWLWSPWHRIEVFNTIRQLTQHPESHRRLRRADAQQMIRVIEADIRAEYFRHGEVDWRDVFRTANELSIAHALSLRVRSADLLHVAYALELAADEFVGFDGDQLALAAAAGMQTITPPR